MATGSPTGPRELLSPVSLKAFVRHRCRRLGGLPESEAGASPSARIQTLDASQTVAEALGLLAARQVLSAPVYGPPTGEGKGARVARGFIDVRDILEAFLRLVHETREEVYHLGLLDRMAVLDGEGSRFGALRLGAIMPEGGLPGDVSLYLAEEGCSLLQAAEEGMLAPGAHRVAMVASANGQIVDIVSQSDIVRFLHTYSDSIAKGHPTLDKNLTELGLSNRPVVSVNANIPCIVAFDHMRSHAVSGVALTGSSGQLIGNLSASDLRRVNPTHFASLGLPVCEFLALLSGTSYTGYASGDGEQIVGEPPITVEPGDTLRKVLEVVAKARTHRVYVVDGAGVPVSVITLSDLLRAALSEPPPP